MRIQWWLRIGLIACAVALGVLNWAIRQPPAVTGGDEGFEVVTRDRLPDGPAGPQLVNDDWEITDMATAHGAFVIEIEADDPERTEEIARALVEPIKADYDEILVYVHLRGNDSDLPARRMQWTPAAGYSELTYPDPDPAAPPD